MKRISRRSFLMAAGLGVAALGLAACGGAASASTAASASSAASGSTAAAESDLDDIKGKGKMVIGYTVYEPMNYTASTATLPGLTPSLPPPCARSWAWSRSSWRSTGIPRWWSWTQEHRLHLERHDPDR